MYNIEIKIKELGQDIKRFITKKKADIVMDIFQGKITMIEVSRKYDLAPAVIEEWMEEARRGMENQLRACPKDIAIEVTIDRVLPADRSSKPSRITISSSSSLLPTPRNRME